MKLKIVFVMALFPGVIYGGQVAYPLNKRVARTNLGMDIKEKIQGFAVDELLNEIMQKTLQEQCGGHLLKDAAIEDKKFCYDFYTLVDSKIRELAPELQESYVNVDQRFRFLMPRSGCFVVIQNTLRCYLPEKSAVGPAVETPLQSTDDSKLQLSGGSAPQLTSDELQPILKPQESSFWAKVSLLFSWLGLTSSSPSHSHSEVRVDRDLPKSPFQPWWEATSSFFGKWFFFWA